MTRPMTSLSLFHSSPRHFPCCLVETVANRRLCTSCQNWKVLQSSWRIAAASSGNVTHPEIHTMRCRQNGHIPLKWRRKKSVAQQPIDYSYIHIAWLELYWPESHFSSSRRHDGGGGHVVPNINKKHCALSMIDARFTAHSGTKKAPITQNVPIIET